MLVLLYEDVDLEKRSVTLAHSVHTDLNKGVSV